MSDTPTTPRILALTGTPKHPQALIQSIDVVLGRGLFAYLDASGNRVDSGKSIFSFTPVPATPATTPATYVDPGDAALIAAISAI